MRKVFSILFVIISTAFTSRVFAQTSELYQKTGDAFMGVHDFQSASDNYTKAINKKGHDKNYMAVLYGKRSVCWLELQAYDKCLKDCNEAIALDSTIRGAYWNRGAVYDHSRYYLLAIKDYKKVITLLPVDDATSAAILYLNIANDEYIMRDVDKAVKDDSLAVSFNPKYSRAYWLMGTINASLGKYDAAIDDYTTTIFYFDGQKTMLSAIYAERAFNKLHVKKYKAALNDYSYAILLNPDNKLAYWDRAAAYHANGDYKLATDDYTKAITYFADNATLSKLYNDRALNEIGQNLYADAVKDGKKSIELDPDNKDAYWNEASAYLQDGDYEESNKVFRKLLTIYSQSTQAMDFIKTQIANNEYFLGHYDKAFADCNEVIADNNNNVDAHYCRAQVLYKKMNKKEEAMDDFNAILQEDTSKKSVVYVFALYYTGKSDDAIAILQNDVLTNNSSISVNGDYYNLACLYSLMNQPDEANTYLKKAIDNGYSKKYAAADEDLNNIRNTDDYKNIMAAN